MSSPVARYADELAAILADAYSDFSAAEVDEELWGGLPRGDIPPQQLVQIVWELYEAMRLRRP